MKRTRLPDALFSQTLIIVGLAMACLANYSIAGTGSDSESGPGMGSGRNRQPLISSDEVASRGVGFRVIADPVWQPPKTGLATDIHLALQLTSYTESDLYSCRFETVRPMIKAASGHLRESRFARDLTKRGKALSNALRPGQSTSSSLARLTRRSDGQLDLSGDDGSVGPGP